MKRMLYNKLLNWKNSSNRKPLLLQGARQVGKTWLIDELGRREYSKYIYVNFEQTPELSAIFSSDKNPKRIITDISLVIGKKVQSKDTLIFFDEIQASPDALLSLKYFCEQAPEYHIIAAGSLLGVSIGKRIGFPVGKVNFLTLYPMTFYEYLLAFGEELVAETLKQMVSVKTLSDIVHERMLRHLKMYLYLGGMPEVLQDFLDNNNIASVRKIQKEILEAYRRDFSKYTDGNQAIKTIELWHSIPGQLARENKKFKYNDIRKNARASMYEQTIEWLRSAGLINIANNISTPKVLLLGYADPSKFKIYLHDTGLLAAMLNLSSQIIVEPTAIFSEYNGAFIENYVAQQFVAHGSNQLYYWTSKSDAEVDFVLQVKNEIIPVEVKSGMNRNLKSLRSYADKYNPNMLYRLSPRNFIQSDDFINLPLYATFLTGKFDLE